MKNERQFVYALIDDQDEIYDVREMTEKEATKVNDGITLRVGIGWRWQKLSEYPVAAGAL